MYRQLPMAQQGDRSAGGRPRLVATDLDGTVVRDDGTISGRTVAAFARAEQAGALVVVVTGRPPRAMAEISGAFGHRGTAIVSNGAMTYACAGITAGIGPQSWSKYRPVSGLATLKRCRSTS